MLGAEHEARLCVDDERGKPEHGGERHRERTERAERDAAGLHARLLGPNGCGQRAEAAAPQQRERGVATDAANRAPERPTIPSVSHGLGPAIAPSNRAPARSGASTPCASERRRRSEKYGLSRTLAGASAP